MKDSGEQWRHTFRCAGMNCKSLGLEHPFTYTTEFNSSGTPKYGKITFIPSETHSVFKFTEAFLIKDISD